MKIRFSYDEALIGIIFRLGWVEEGRYSVFIRLENYLFDGRFWHQFLPLSLDFLYFFFWNILEFELFGNDSLPKSIDMVLTHYKSRHTNRLIEKKKKHKSLLRVNCMLHAMSG